MRVQRILIVFIVLALLGIAWIGIQAVGSGLPGLGLFGAGEARLPWLGPAAGSRIALISGHAGNDSGAVCEAADGSVTLTEAAVNAAVAERAAERLRRAGAGVELLQEFDPRLDDLRADLLLSLHADSCIDASGYKAAAYVYSQSEAADARLLACIDSHYPAATGLPHHPNTVTHNMTQYHAFHKIAPSTPAAILELGFLGGDRTLLESQPERVAQGVAESILCFLRPDPTPQAAETGDEAATPSANVP